MWNNPEICPGCNHALYRHCDCVVGAEIRANREDIVPDLTPKPTLAERAERAMRASGKVPEPRVLAALDDAALEAIISYWGEPRA